MPPGEEHQDYFTEDVGVRNVEVMLQRRDVDITVELFIVSAAVHRKIPSSLHSVPHIQFHASMRSAQLGTPSEPSGHL